MLLTSCHNTCTNKPSVIHWTTVKIILRHSLSWTFTFVSPPPLTSMLLLMPIGLAMSMTECSCSIYIYKSEKYVQEPKINSSSSLLFPISHPLSNFSQEPEINSSNSLLFPTSHPLSNFGQVMKFSKNSSSSHWYYIKQENRTKPFSLIKVNLVRVMP